MSRKPLVLSHPVKYDFRYDGKRYVIISEAENGAVIARNVRTGRECHFYVSPVPAVNR